MQERQRVAIVPSGWAPLDERQEDLLLKWAAEQIPASLPMPRGTEPAAFDERLSRQGAFAIGGEMGTAWAAVSLRSQEALLEEVKPVIQRRDGLQQCFDNEQELVSWCQQQSLDGLRCIWILGTSVSWKAQEQLQMAGLWVGRLPLDEPQEAACYARRLVGAEREKRPLPRRAWVFAPNNDAFTQALHSLLVLPLERLLKEMSFEVRCFPRDGTPAADKLPGLVMFLTHGENDPRSGNPVGLRALEVSRVREACAQGVVVAHLGCNGAGALASGRYGQLAERLYGYRFHVPEQDVFSAFARNYLNAGARALLAHVDITWSNVLHPNGPFLFWLHALASGNGAMGFSASKLSMHANIAARTAFEQRAKGQEREAGEQSLRHLDLSGFVTLGEPASSLYWA